jgi:hypothetical protein
VVHDLGLDRYFDWRRVRHLRARSLTLVPRRHRRNILPQLVVAAKDTGGTPGPDTPHSAVAGLPGWADGRGPFAHTLFITIIRSALTASGLRASLPWEATVAILFVGTVAITGTFVSIVVRTPLRWVLGGPVRSEERASYVRRGSTPFAPSHPTRTFDGKAEVAV